MRYFTVVIGAFLMMLPVICRAETVARVPRNMKIIGHRGVQNETPQNTLAGIRRAIELGLDYVEVDLRATADGKIIDMHNRAVDETTNGKGLVSQLTLGEIRKLDAGSWFNPAFKGEKVPLFGEELALGKGRIKFYIDMKSADPIRVVRLLQQFDMVQDAVIFGGPDELAAMQEADHRILVMPHLESADQMPALAAKLHPKFVEYSSGPLKPEVLAAAHDFNAQMFMDIMNEGETEESILGYLNAGVDGIQCDNPRLAVEVLTRAGVKRPAPRPLPPPLPPKGPRADGDHVKLIAHRGAAKYAPQGTAYSFAEALRLGMDYVEMDLQTTADGVLVDMHNDEVDATTNGHGLVKDLTYAEIRGLDAGSWFGSRFKGAHVPLFAEELAMAKNRCGLYIDWKEADPEPVARLLQEFDMTRDVLVHADEQTSLKLRELDPSIILMPGADGVEGVREILRLYQPQAIELRWRSFSEDAVRLCHELNILAITSHAGARGDNPKDIRRGALAGLDGWETDQPEMSLAVLRSLKQGA